MTTEQINLPSRWPPTGQTRCPIGRPERAVRFHLDRDHDADPTLVHTGQRYTLVVRNQWELTTGEDDIPFWAQPTLGGARNLRAFGEGRFYGQNSVFASAELRVQMMHMVILGMPMDVEISPFIDAGQVFENTPFKGKVNVNPGVSMRILNRPNVGLIVNWAHGQDGGQLTGGVSLPF